MSGKVTRRVLAVSLLLAAAGCNKTQTGGAIDAGGSAAAPTPAVIQAACPPISLRDGTSSYRTYAKGAKDDPSKIVYQASLANSTRQCVQSADKLTMTVVVQGRVVAGPAGGPGKVTLPIRVAATDGDTTLYSELTQFPVEVPAGTTQFVFTKADVTLPAGAGAEAKVFVGFDEGPYRTK
ncbi:hypothetical protein GOC91_10190 [Sinorhizobium medicae]|uniref:Lipoprotein n=3 Tax=Sinorhizobium medicae TaxID=110321 RepID=A0A508X5M6_9HYPH|nr:hypothetical protein [Sinorhizobium medicae]ABR59393.1 conserved hypothetical protein [Sinorhizobium medicae WSM419]MBO1939451.1 hypothetical protein [Sinorhizobium medicae]MBO1963321.1 hypothetical protein [Sinorhizobium medicae]MDX0404019.1 hypothetical protein [Sinorhizobium medicae]MDX0409879.1 hypothetical protein [Sinorhizobium medicae]